MLKNTWLLLNLYYLINNFSCTDCNFLSLVTIILFYRNENRISKSSVIFNLFIIFVYLVISYALNDLNFKHYPLTQIIALSLGYFIFLDYILFQDERGRLMRRNIVRYAVLAYVITLKQVSIRVKKRFPTLQHIVDAGEYLISMLKCKK